MPASGFQRKPIISPLLRCPLVSQVCETLHPADTIQPITCRLPGSKPVPQGCRGAPPDRAGTGRGCLPQSRTTPESTTRSLRWVNIPACEKCNGVYGQQGTHAASKMPTRCTSTHTLAYMQTKPPQCLYHHTMHIFGVVTRTQELPADHQLSAEAGAGAALVAEQHLRHVHDPQYLNPKSSVPQHLLNAEAGGGAALVVEQHLRQVHGHGHRHLDVAQVVQEPARRPAAWGACLRPG